MSSQQRTNGLYWVFFGEDWTIAQYQYYKYNQDGNWRVIGDEVDRCDDDFEFIGEMIEPKAKSITTISGSKYNYTEQSGDNLVSYGFDTFKELSDFIVAQRRKIEADPTL